MKIRIENFQSLEDVEFDVDGYTTIVGSSELGKSAIIRAIGYALYGVRGTFFVRKGKASSKVTFKFDGNTIIWEKGPKVNSYIINGKQYDKVNTDIPSEVSDLGFKLIRFGEHVITPQLQKQHKYAFLVDREEFSDPVVGGFIGSLSTSYDITKANKLCGSQIKSSKSDLTDNLDKLKKSTALLEKSKVVYISGKSTFENLSIVINEIDKKEYTISLIDEFQNRFNKANLIKSFIAGVALPNISALYQLDDKIRYANSIILTYRLKLLIDSLSKVDITHLQNLNDKANNIKDIVKFFSGKNLIESENVLFESMNACINNVSIILYKDSIMSHLIDSYNELSNLKQSMDSTKNLIKLKEDEVHLFEKEIGVCPLCGNKL
ncbi:MAG: AAA family ATPase [Candidatus Paceibacterota bacterium]|jgi:hypothetical protein